MPDPTAKQVVSVRLSASDIERVKTVARRLRVYETEVFRFALKTVLARLAPLCDSATTGRDLMPVFADCGPEMVAHFQLDESRLTRILDEGTELTDNAVDRLDVSLLALSSMPDSFAYQSLFERLAQEVLSGGEPLPGLREYLNRKYISTEARASASSAAGQVGPGD